MEQVFRGASDHDHAPRWESLWVQQVTPWDRGGPSPALVSLLASGTSLIPTLPRQTGDRAGAVAHGSIVDGTVPRKVTSASADTSSIPPPLPEKKPRPVALVPGCGRGHDVLLLARYGFDVCGVDISATAIAEARDLATKMRTGASSTCTGSGRTSDEMSFPDRWEKGTLPVQEWGKVTYFQTDFLDEENNAWLEDLGTQFFDLIFDYTFLCALPLSLRPTWARRMASLLRPRSPTARLVCLEFPTTRGLAAGGPPFAVDSDTYQVLLAQPGRAIEYGEDRVPTDTYSEFVPGEQQQQQSSAVTASPPPSTESPPSSEESAAAPQHPEPIVAHRDARTGDVLAHSGITVLHVAERVRDADRERGLQRLALLRPSITHASGMKKDGSGYVLDSISVYGHFT